MSFARQPRFSALGRSLLHSAPQQGRCFASAAAPSAKQLLDSAGVKPGDVLVQNCADSAAGQAVIQEAKGRGITTVNVIADKPGSADIIERLKHEGADIVVTESYCNTWFVRRLLSDLPAPAAGLNSSSGTQATAVARLLGKGSTLVTYQAKLPPCVPYAGAEKRAKAWQDYFKEKGITAKSL